MTGSSDEPTRNDSTETAAPKPLSTFAPEPDSSSDDPAARPDKVGQFTSSQTSDAAGEQSTRPTETVAEPATAGDRPSPLSTFAPDPAEDPSDDPTEKPGKVSDPGPA